MPLAVVIAFAVGLLLETTIFSRLYRRDHLYQVLLTFGLILIFEELRSIFFGDDVHGVAVPALLEFFHSADRHAFLSGRTVCSSRRFVWSSPA